MFAMLPFRAVTARQPQPHRSAARPGVTQPVMTPPAGGTTAPGSTVGGP